MGAAAKKRANAERLKHAQSTGRSASGDSSSSGHVSQSQPSSPAMSQVSRRTAYDGNRDPGSPVDVAPRVYPKNIDLGVGTWANVVRPPTLSSLGQAIKVSLNTFNVESVPKKNVYQFEVLIGDGAEKRGLIKNVWESKAVKAALGEGWIFDGNRLAWSTKPVEREMRLIVDLAQEKGKTPRPGKEDRHRVVIRQTGQIRFDVLMAYLSGRITFDNTCLDAINFLDHLLREWPRKQYSQIKRSFFTHGKQRFPLGSGVEALKGVFQTLRVVHGGRLSVNVDVANGVFWAQNHLVNAAIQVLGCRDASDLVQALRQGDRGNAGKKLKTMRKLHVTSRHRGGIEDKFVIDNFVYQSARDYKFEDAEGKKTSIYEYYANKYKVRLHYPDLPLVKATRGKNTMLPMEILSLVENQRYNYKMDERQTSQMIKYAATYPPDRLESIENGLKMLDWANDPMLRSYGMQINREKAQVGARLLTAPTVKFGTGEAKPGTSGRWDLKGKKFLAPNSLPLKSWAVCVVPSQRGGKPDRSAVERFIAEFVKIYQLHGGRVENKQPAMSLAGGTDVSQWVTSTWNAAGNQTQSRPQILVFILPDKNSQVYGRIKRSGECRYGVVTQCMQYAHVQKCQGQYISNVCMKFNAKLGGITARAIGPKSGGPTGLMTKPTMIIGADVSHAAPGAQVASMAAITMSMDKLATRYAASCQTNGYRVEMISTENIRNIIKPLAQHWMSSVNNGEVPNRIIYLRDGVSEAQYQHVIDQEVKDMKQLFKETGKDIPFLVAVGSKRHNVRFFPERGDRNGNPLPGTLVETGVTHPFDHDFYLCAHAAIKGTARPAHYYVLLNEMKMPADELYTLLYEHSYQFIRATTPVSQHPAIYYAHIASNRAASHDPHWAGSSDGKPQDAKQKSGSQSGSQAERSGGPGGSSTGAPGDFEKLLDMPTQGGIKTSMWYI